jgi:Ca2+-binding EF-hand superfamily protein
MLDKNEFRKFLEQVAKNIGGTPPTEADFDEAFKGFDKDNSGKISFDEAFKEWVSFSMLVNLSKE